MTTAAFPAAASSPLGWLRGFLREELAPYPGRVAVVARMVIAATLVMIICMTFRIPYGFEGALYTLWLSRESPQATIRAAAAILLATGTGAAYLLLSVGFLISAPLLHLFWVIGSLFLAFYAMSVVTDYSAAVLFAIVISFGVPLWDRIVPAEINVQDTLWLCLAMLTGVMVTVAVEVVFAAFKPWDDVIVAISERLEWIERLLRSRMEGLPDRTSEQQVTRLATLGTSRLRRNLLRSNYSPHYAEKMGAVVAFVGSLVDIAANLPYFSEAISGDEEVRLRRLCENITSIREDLLNRRPPHLAEPYRQEDAGKATPLLREMEQTVSLLAEVFTGTPELGAFAPSATPAEPGSVRIFSADAFTNAEHIHFALRGGLAASLCYLAYNLIAWPGISIAVSTCVVTALTTIGSSRQKQILRFGGVVTGGVIGMASQVFILPALDSITGFLLLFVTVTILAAWIATSSPRLSYFGIQTAFAFYFINLAEFRFQTSLAVARDRVAGILLGLFVMWLVFDQIGGVPAAVAMKRTFVNTLQLLAQIFREPASADLRKAVEKSYALRQTITTNLGALRQQADGVLLEFGPDRQHNLALREQLIQWQLRLRMVFIARVALYKYRLRLPGFDLPAAMRSAQQEFDQGCAARLESMADRLEGKEPVPREDPEFSVERLEEIASECCSERSDVPAASLRTFLALSRRIDGLLRSVEDEIRTASANR